MVGAFQKQQLIIVFPRGLFLSPSMAAAAAVLTSTGLFEYTQFLKTCVKVPKVETVDELESDYEDKKAKE